MREGQFEEYLEYMDITEEEKFEMQNYSIERKKYILTSDVKHFASFFFLHK